MRHILGGHDVLPSPIRHFFGGGRVPPVPRGIYAPAKVIDHGVNRKLTYDFLLDTNSNFGRICYRFRDIDA